MLQNVVNTKTVIPLFSVYKLNLPTVKRNKEVVIHKVFGVKRTIMPFQNRSLLVIRCAYFGSYRIQLQFGFFSEFPVIYSPIINTPFLNS